MFTIFAMFGNFLRKNLRFQKNQCFDHLLLHKNKLVESKTPIFSPNYFRQIIFAKLFSPNYFRQIISAKLFSPNYSGIKKILTSIPGSRNSEHPRSEAQAGGAAEREPPLPAGEGPERLLPDQRDRLSG
jgi:hypothetical protein